MKLIFLGKGQFTEVDEEDFKELSQYRWTAHWDRKTLSYYATRHEKDSSGKDRTILMHRELLGLEYRDGIQGDHINGNTLDNRLRSNLRSASVGENQRNKGLQSNNTSGFKSVHLHKPSNKYVARIKLNGKRKHLGSRPTAEAAHRELYIPAALAMHAEFAHV